VVGRSLQAADLCGFLVSASLRTTCIVFVAFAMLVLAKLMIQSGEKSTAIKRAGEVVR